MTSGLSTLTVAMEFKRDPIKIIAYAVYGKVSWKTSNSHYTTNLTAHDIR